MHKYFSAVTLVGLFIGIFFLLAGCSQTKVTSVWVDPEYQGAGINNVFVVGVSKDGGL